MYKSVKVKKLTYIDKTIYLAGGDCNRKIYSSQPIRIYFEFEIVGSSEKCIIAFSTKNPEMMWSWIKANRVDRFLNVNEYLGMTAQQAKSKGVYLQYEYVYEMEVALWNNIFGNM